jgi:hypothetical protein
MIDNMQTKETTHYKKGLSENKKQYNNRMEKEYKKNTKYKSQKIKKTKQQKTNEQLHKERLKKIFGI